MKIKNFHYKVEFHYKKAPKMLNLIKLFYKFETFAVEYFEN